MSTKLPKGAFPSGHSVSDFKCHGPVATIDGEFDNAMMADMGCFTQDGKDSNKWYHGAVVESKIDGSWYAYFEWGRTGRSSVDRQFVECSSKAEAQTAFAKQMHSKNDKRGEWADLGGKKVLRAKKGKDCYLIRPLANRTHGLPDAQNISADETSKSAIKKKVVKKTTKKASSGPSVDSQTRKLLADMGAATVSYARTSIVGGMIPTLSAIEEAREMLEAAQKRIAIIGNDINEQINDDELRGITDHVYSRIPKEKPLGSIARDWLLTQDNIALWGQDLDAFESAGKTVEVQENKDNPLVDMNLNMEWLDPANGVGKFIHEWLPNASRDKHHGVGRMKIRNVWVLDQNGSVDRFDKSVDKIKKISAKKCEALHQPKNKRPDLDKDRLGDFMRANVAMLFHGTRSVNVTGILRENLRLPKNLVGVVITGAMFGPGLYWADDWKKSDGYTSRPGTYWSRGGGGVKGRGAFMFVADVALGKVHVASGPSGYSKAPTGCHSVMGAAGKSRVQNNEFIVYNTNQHHLRYLVEYDA